MLATGKPLADLTASDLMSRDLVLIPKHMDLRTAARILSRAQVSGAPVIDSAGALAGVISATDFLNRAREDGHERARTCSQPCVCADWQMVNAESLPPDSVGAHMTRDPVTAAATANIHELARQMLDAHIHRVIIVDVDNRPVGIVSSTDILAALAREEGIEN
jgi:CBS domain-containing membrane protein